LTHKGGKAVQNNLPKGPVSAPQLATANGAPLPPRATTIPQSVPLLKPPISTLPKIPNGDSDNALNGVGEKTGDEPLTPAGAMQSKGTQSAAGPRRTVEAQDAAGGHTIERHVGKSEAWLRKRLEMETDKKFTSSFRNEAIANRVQGRMVNRCQDQIQAWLKSGKTRPLQLEIDMHEPVGIIVERGKSGSVVTTKATAYIARDNSAQGWHFVTSYPSK
jgi:Bacterial CdiA-CT RNAse A domain